ncbi:MAG TPA: hypothetical protein VE995_02730 [Gaiellaceae bacterium]|nr:hypothetical protein [Gaiellaceae bacterium]
MSFIREHGGHLYVWPRVTRCGGGRWLRASLEPNKRIAFARRDEVEEFELYMPAVPTPLPDELEVDLARFPRRVEVYWNGCAWIV